MSRSDGSSRKHPPLSARFSTQVFRAGLVVAGALARRPEWAAATRALMRGFAVATLAAKRAQRQHDVRAVANEWQRMMPSPKLVPITAIEADTAYAEIHGDCPVRATGDLAACHRMMEYDRRMLATIGGTFVVLASKADPAVAVCRVAMRLRGADTSDLVPAYRAGERD